MKYSRISSQIKRRSLFFMVLFFVFGLLLQGALSLSLLSMCLLFACSALLIIINIKSRNAFFVLGLLVFSMLFGFFYMNLRLDVPKYKSGEYTVEASLAAGLEKRERGFRARLEGAYITDENGIKSRVGRLYWSFDEEMARLPCEGDLVRFSGYLYTPSKAENPYGYDFRKSFLGAGIFYGVSGGRDFVNLSESFSSNTNILKLIKLRLSKNIDACFPNSAGLQKALILGIKSDMPEQQRLEFRRSGTAHLLAISGFHISLLALVLEFVLTFLGLSRRKSFLVCSAFLLSYVAMLNFIPSAFRAMLMYFLVSLAKMLRTKRDGLSICALSALVILLISPTKVYDIGFQLSFLAVLGIIIMGDLLTSLAKKAEERLNFNIKNRLSFSAGSVIKKITLGYITAFSAILFTFPLSIYYFSYFSLIGVVLGPVFIFLMGLLLPFNILCLALYSIFGQGLLFLARLADKLSLMFVRLNSLASGLNLAGFSINSMSILMSLGLILIFVLLSRYFYKSLKFKAFFVVCLSVFMLVLPLVQRNSGIRYIQFSCGRADSGVIELDGNLYAIDCGYEAEALLPYLRAKGNKLEGLFITHLHADHVGGAKKLIENGINIKRVYFPKNAEMPNDIDRSFDYIEAFNNAGIETVFLSKGDEFDFGRLKISVVWPYENALYASQKANNTSLALLMRLDDVTLLSAGDLGSEYEKYCAYKADILKLSHHGSRYSSLPELIKKALPKAVIISTSQRYEHMTRLSGLRSAAQGAGVFSTAKRGAVIIDIDGDKYKIHNYLSEDNQWTE